MAKAKQTAFVLDEKVYDSIPSSEPQTFGSVPGLWVKDVPVLLTDLDPTLTEQEFKRLVKEADAPIVATKVDADYSPHKRLSQLDLRQKGGTPHLPSGLPLVEGAPDVDPYRDRSLSELEPVAEAMNVDDAADLNKTETLAAIEEQTEGGKK
jgi:hypothetical protein